MKKINSNLLITICAYLILAGTILFHLWLNFPETQVLADPNDNIFQYSLVYRTNWVWENYSCPLSLACLPNLVDHNVTAWAEGYPLPFYYSHIPQIATVSTYNLFIKPLSSVLSSPISLYQYYNFTKYLLLALFPLPIFLALRIVGFSPLASSVTAFLGSNLSTDGLYGIDPPSFLWRGYGLTSQLFGMFFFPLVLAFTYRALKKISKRDAIWASIFLILTTSGHLGVGMMGFLSLVPFVFLDFKLGNIKRRIKILMLIYAGVGAALAYWIVPILFANNYHIISFWDPIWKFNSYGWYESIRQFLQGELFDWKRAPLVTVLVVAGFFSLLTSPDKFTFALLFAFWFLLFFGRPTWGSLIDLIPGMKEFHLHRFILGIQMAGLFLIPAALEFLHKLLKKILETAAKFVQLLQLFTEYLLTKKETRPLSLPANSSIYLKVTLYILLLTIISTIVYFTAKQTVDYAWYNNKWIREANLAYLQDEKNFNDVLAYLKTKPSARLYAGRPGNWGKNFRLGSSEMYMLFGINGLDVSQFLPETWSPLSENEQNFDERVAEDYDLLNISYVVAPQNYDFASSVQSVKKFGPFALFEAKTSGWFDIVTSPMLVKTDKTNFINIVQLWHRSYPRRWKMHPLISVEKKPNLPVNIKRILTMKDEVTYEEEGRENNIFADFPFVFPEATPSGQIKDEKVDKQTYSVTVNVPDNCQSPCFTMFKMSYHPDWEARVDGKKVEKYAVFPFYLAAPVSPGTHRVEFTYKPNALKTVLLYGELLSLFVILVLMVRKKLKAK